MGANGEDVLSEKNKNHWFDPRISSPSVNSSGHGWIMASMGRGREERRRTQCEDVLRFNNISSVK